MSINKTGLDTKAKSMDVTISVKIDDPLIALCNKLDWVEMGRIIEGDLKKTAKGFWNVGRPISIRSHLGVHLLQGFNKWTDRQTEEYILSTPKYQIFCGLGSVDGWKCPDHTKVEEFRNRLSLEVRKTLGDYFLKLAVQCGFADPKWMDIDSTVQEANMAYPADSNILKKLSLKAKKVLDYLKSRGVKQVKDIEIDIKGICKKAQEYFFLSKNKAKEIKHKIFNEYLEKVQQELSPLIDVIEKLPKDLKQTCKWNMEKAIDVIQQKARQYLLDVKHFAETHTIKPGKLLCLHLTAVACIAKGKVDKVREFGRLVQLGRIGGNFMVPLSNEVKMEDKQSIAPMVANHAQIFGQGCLKEIGADKGYYTHENTKNPATMGINTDGLQRPSSIKSKPSEDVAQPLRDRRAGIEPLIGHVKSFGLRKSKMKSDASTHASVYTSVMAFNMRQIYRHMTGQMKKA
jgi:hypothetical protein